MEQLIDPPPPDGPSDRRSDGARKLAAVQLFVSLVIIMLTPVIDALSPVVKPTLMGDEARLAADERGNRSLFDGSLMRAAGRQLRLRSRIRHTLAPYWSAFLLRYLDDAPDAVVVGRDGWLFLRSRVWQPASVSDGAPETAAAYAAAFQRRLAVHGSRLVIAPITRKAIACAEMLPGDIQRVDRFDAAVYAELARRGVEAIDVPNVFASLDVGARYLPCDTHWTREAVVAFAREVASRFPELVTNEADATVSWRDKKAESGLLGFAAIPPKHPASSIIDVGSTRTWEIEPDHLRTLSHSKSTNADVAIVGSSFTEHFGLADALAWQLGRPVYPGGCAGSRFGDPIGRMNAALGGEDLAPFVIYEFPIHQVFDLGRSPAWGAGPIGGVFQYMSSPDTTPLDADAIGETATRPRPDERTGQNGWARTLFRSGTLLSTGDGVMQLVLRVESPDESRWQVRTPETLMTFVVAPGAGRITIPVFEREGASSFTALVAIDAAAAEANYTIVPSIDADLSRARELTATTGERVWTFSADQVPIERHDIALVSWDGAARRIEIECVGRTADEREVRVERTFIGARSEVAVMGLSALHDSQLEYVRITASGPGRITTPSVSIAPLAAR